MTNPDQQTTQALGITSAMSVWIGGHQIEAKRAIEPYLLPTTRPATGPIDVAFITPETPEEAVYFTDKIAPRLVQNAMIWVIDSIDPLQHDTHQTLLSTMNKSNYVETKKVKLSESFIATGFSVSSSQQH